uniref:Uncharacterized protein n=1 Tax=Romanomermis culicivorax TaxID=13658 RepID=A0A915IWF7_ROMCU
MTIDPDFDYDPSAVVKNFDPSLAIKTGQKLLKVVSDQAAMGSLETVIREAHKFVRLADDLHDIKFYLNDIRLCFVALTVSGYVGILLYGLYLCINNRRQRNNGAAGRSNGAPSAMAGSRHRQSYGGDEEMNYGWKTEEQMIKLNPNRTSNDRYTTRSLNRNAQNYKSDSCDSPSKKLLLENHNALSGVIIEPSNGQNQIPPTNKENGGIAHRM